MSSSPMVGEFNTAPATVGSGQKALVQTDNQGRLFVTASGGAPVGGGITWGAATAVAMTGASKTFVAANAARKGIIIWNPSGNAAASYELAGGTATVAGSIPLGVGAAPTYFTGADCPVGIISAIGTNTQNLYYIEGV